MLAEATAEAQEKANDIRAAKRFEPYVADPTRYALEVLGVRWWKAQIEIGQSVLRNRRTAVYAGHGVGKTHGIAGLAQWHFDCFRPSITLTTAPNWASIHDLLWGEIKKQRPASALGRLLDLRLDGGPMHYCKGHNAETSAGFQGRHEQRMLIVLDEAMGLPHFIWEATNAMLLSPESRVLVAGNPTETSGEYYAIRENPDWSVFTISCLDHPNIAAELAGLPAPYPQAVSLVWLEEMIAKHATRTTTPTADSFEFPPGSGNWFDPDDIFRSRVLGLFPRQSSSAVWSEAWLTEARKGGLVWSDSDEPEIGVDVARFGDDKTTLYARRGPVVTHGDEYARQDLMETAGRVIRLADTVAEAHKVDVKKIALKVDDTGMGGGVTDRLNEQGYRVVPINAGSKAVEPEQYHNRRSELWFTTAYRARDRRLDLSRLPEAIFRKLSAELRAVRYKMQSDKRLRVEGKDEYKKRVGHSPDHADGFNLAYASSQITSKLATGDNPFF